MPLKAIVFDWDLPLWNSWDLHLQLMQSSAAALGLPQPTAAQVAQQYHRPFFRHLTWFFGDDEQRLVDTYMAFYHENVITVGHLYSGVLKTLEALKDRGYQIAIFSDKRKQFGDLASGYAGIGHLLDYTLFLVDGRPYKPDPLGLLHVLEALGAEKSRAVYVGDGSHDLDCARRAGIASGAALWGSLDPEEQGEMLEEIVEEVEEKKLPLPAIPSGILRQLPRSRPLARLTTGTAAPRVADEPSRAARKPWVGTATSTRAASEVASPRSAVASRSCGRSHPGR